MTEPSLFPDVMPDREPDPPKRSCCAELHAPDGVPPRVWEFIHATCHSRVPFSAQAFMAVADATENQTRRAIAAATRLGWLHPVWPEPYMENPTPQWVGCLPRRR